MNTNQINYLNIGLMFFSAGLAFAYPFELFLIVYTVLGPLHYLTEISWLQERHYYTKGKYDYLFLIAATVVLTLGNLRIIPGLSNGALAWLLFIPFGAALAFVTFKTTLARWLTVLMIASAGLLITTAPLFAVVFGVFLPTLIHVFVFTGCFILAGALKHRNLSGYLSLGVFILISLSFLWFHPSHSGYETGAYVSSNYGLLQNDGSMTNTFLAVNFFFAKLFNFQGFNLSTTSLSDFSSAVNTYLYHNPTALALMSFIAFAYSYHYFNWFSKTSIIRWHEVPKRYLAAAVALWMMSLGLYAYNYMTGLRWLLFLSLVHVVLEFPLNHLTFIQIGKELGGRFTSTQKSSSPVSS